MGFVEEFKNRRLKRLADRAAEKHGDAAKDVSEFMVRRARRLAERFDETPDSWITVNGNHIPLDEEKNPIGGQMKSFGDIGGKDYDPMFKPKNPSDEYDWEGVESVQDFIKKKANVEKTKAIFKEGGLDAVEQEFLFARMAESSKNLHEIKPKEDLSKYDDELDRIKLTQDAVSDELYEDVRESLIHGWTRGADSGYKPTILRAVIRTEKARNAALNLSYLAYQEYSALDKARGGEDHQEFKSFEDFLTTPIKMYRGENGQSRLKEDVFSAYSFDKRVAQHFAGNSGKVHEITVRPIDTLGNIVPTGEYEVMVPDWLEKRVRHDGKERLWLRLDENPDSWITLENGEHVPLDASGNALGGAGGWATGKNFSNANKGVEKKPQNSDYDWEGVDDFQSFMHKNAKKLKPIYENGGRDSVETEYRTAMMERSSHNLSEIKPVETGLKSIDRKEAINAAMDTLVEEVGDSKLAGWLRNEDSSYKPAIMDGILSSDKARNAALNIMYRLYQYERDDTVSFEDFLTKPIKLYRGEHGQERVADDVFSAYSFDKRMAGKFAGENGKVHEIEVRPIDTLGSPRAAGEAEVMVPSWIEKKVRHDAADDGEWVTTENGNHVHISEEGFPDKGNPFVISEMNSEFLDAAKDADNAVEFWMNLSEDQQKKVGKSYKEIYESVKKVAGEKDEWVAPKGKIEDMPTKLEEPKEPIQFEIANQKYGGSATADADIKGKIRLYANQSDTWSDNVFYHELGHQIEQLGIETDVALNHGGLFGKYNQKKNVFASPTGYVEKNPDEMFATLFADYISRPSWLKEKAPEVHEYFDKLNADNPWLSGFVEQTKADYQTAIDRYQKRKDSVDEFRNRRQSRRDAKEDEGRWVTTEEGHHVHFNENGEPDKGNPYVLNAMKVGTKTKAQLGKIKIGKTLKRINGAVSEYNKAWQENKILYNEWYEAESIYRSKKMETRMVASYKNTLKGWGLDGKSSDELRKETDKLKEQRSRLQEGKLTKDEANSFFRQWKNRRIEGYKSELESGTMSRDVYDKLVSDTNNTSLDTFMESWADSNLEFQINRYEMAAERKKDIEDYKESDFKEAEEKRAEALDRREKCQQRIERAEKAIVSEISRRNIDKIRFLEDDERETIINNARSSSAFEKLSDEQKQSMIDSLKTASDAELSILDQTCGKVEMKEIPDGSTSHYTEGRGVLYIETEDFSNPSVMWHEYGHFLDDGKCSGMDLYEERLNEWSRHGLSNDLYEHHVVHGKEAAEDMQELLDSKFPGKYDVKTDSASEGYIMITDKETGELADSGLVMVQTMDISSDMFRKLLHGPTEEYRKSVGFPEDIKYSDYFESYFTPKRHIYREKEKFKGAKDAWREALIKREERVEEFLKEHPDFWDNIHKLDEERGINEKRIAPVSDILSAMLHGRFGTIYGSHDMHYYSQDRHTQNECVANYHQMRLMNDTFALNALNQFAPRMTKRLKERYDLWLWKNIKVK